MTDVAKLIGEGKDILNPTDVWGESVEEQAERKALAAHHRHAGGRKTVLTDEFVDVFCRVLTRVASLKMAASLCGVSISAVHNWLQKGARQHHGKFFQFLYRVEEAREEGRYRLLSIVQTGVALDPKLALDLLSRVDPGEYGLTKRVEQKTTVDVTGTVTHEHTYDIAFARAVNEDPDAARLALELLGKIEASREVYDSGQPRLVAVKRKMGSGGSS